MVLAVATIAGSTTALGRIRSLIMPLVVWLAFSTLVVLVQLGWL
jgi:hypothetical protein